MSALLALVAVSVVRETLLDGPELHLDLSNGGAVKVAWCLIHHCRDLYVAEAGGEYISCTAEQTGLDADTLGVYVDRVADLARQEEDERCAGEPPKYSHADRNYGSGL